MPESNAMISCPHVRKIGNSWRVYINDRVWYSNPERAKAIERAHGIATYARRIRFGRDTARIRAAINRMEQR